MKIGLNGNKLKLNDKEIVLETLIRQTLSYGSDKLLVLLTQKPDFCNNVKMFSAGGELLWNIQSVNEAFPEKQEKTYFNRIKIENGIITVTDTMNNNFEVDVFSGKLIKQM